MRLCKKSPKMWPNPFFVIINTQLFTVDKSSPVICATSVILTKIIQSKQSPNRQKFVAQPQLHQVHSRGEGWGRRGLICKLARLQKMTC
jgi:hypothetical protein